MGTGTALVGLSTYQYKGLGIFSEVLGPSGTHSDFFRFQLTIIPYVEWKPTRAHRTNEQRVLRKVKVKEWRKDMHCFIKNRQLIANLTTSCM